MSRPKSSTSGTASVTFIFSVCKDSVQSFEMEKHRYGFSFISQIIRVHMIGKGQQHLWIKSVSISELFPSFPQYRYWEGGIIAFCYFQLLLMYSCKMNVQNPQKWIYCTGMCVCHKVHMMHWLTAQPVGSTLILSNWTARWVYKIS